MNEGMIYSNAVGSQDMALASYPTVPTRFVGTPAQLVASLNASGNGAVFEAFGSSGSGDDERATRLVCGVTINGTDGETCEESQYLVFPTQLDGKDGLEMWATIVAGYTAGPNATANSGMRNNHVDAKAVAITSDTGVVEKLTKVKYEVKNSEPAAIILFDVAECLGVLRIFKKGTSDGCAPTRRRWK
jgi:hypothetical protein